MIYKGTVDVIQVPLGGCVSLPSCNSDFIFTLIMYLSPLRIDTLV